jgi:hypothetical protein
MTAPLAHGAPVSLTARAAGLDGFLPLSGDAAEDDSRPSMFQPKDTPVSSRYDPGGKSPKKMDMRSSKIWRLILVASASAIAAFVVTTGALYQLDMMRSRTRTAEAPVAARLAAAGMEDVISAASRRLSDVADDKRSLARPKNEQKQSENEQLLKQLKAWLDKGANR